MVLRLRGYCTTILKLACFVCYLKIINTFLKSNVCILKYIVILSKELKNGIEILVSQAVFFLFMDQNSQNNVLINNLRTAWPT